MSKGNFELTEPQKLIVLERINDHTKDPPSLKELCEMVFGPGVDGRDYRAKAIKVLCAGYGVRPAPSFQRNYTPIVLNESQKQTIASQASSMTALEIARMLFNENNLLPQDNRCKAVAEYIKTLNPAVVFTSPDEYLLKEYKPPQTPEQALARVRKYTHEPLELGKLTQKQQKDLQSLISNLHVLRFTHQISTYQNPIDRDLFESTFIRHTWPKANDLSNEEVDLCIIIASEAVIEANVKRRIESLQVMLDDAVKEAKDDDKKKISMALVEAIGKLQDERSECVKLQKTLLNDVNVKRSERIKNKVAENQSLAQLMAFWKEQEGRRHMLSLAQAQEKELVNEIDRLKNMDSLIVEIFGLADSEIVPTSLLLPPEEKPTKPKEPTE